MERDSRDDVAEEVLQGEAEDADEHGGADDGLGQVDSVDALHDAEHRKDEEDGVGEVDEELGRLHFFCGRQPAFPERAAHERHCDETGGDDGGCEGCFEDGFGEVG